MQLEHSGWSQERGYFCDKYEIDTSRTDHEIHWKNGQVCKQLLSFQVVETDWNNDHEVYAEFGATFESRYGGREWWTPQSLLSVMLDGKAIIPGIRKI